MAKNTANYGNDSIRQLKDEERVRLRPAVIFGSDGRAASAASRRGRRQAAEAGAYLRSKYADVPPPLPFGFYEPASPRDAGSFLLHAGGALSCGGIDPVYTVYQLI